MHLYECMVMSPLPSIQRNSLYLNKNLILFPLMILRQYVRWLFSSVSIRWAISTKYLLYQIHPSWLMVYVHAFNLHPSVRFISDCKWMVNPASSEYFTEVSAQAFGDNGGSFAITFDVDTDQANTTIFYWHCIDLLEFRGVEYTYCIWTNVARIRVESVEAARCYPCLKWNRIHVQYCGWSSSAVCFLYDSLLLSC